MPHSGFETDKLSKSLNIHNIIEEISKPGSTKNLSDLNAGLQEDIKQFILRYGGEDTNANLIKRAEMADKFFKGALFGWRSAALDMKTLMKQ